jgi:Na+-transporting NADH:ubiquinone oxidoreductase subunit NqrD
MKLNFVIAVAAALPVTVKVPAAIVEGIILVRVVSKLSSCRKIKLLRKHVGLITTMAVWPAGIAKLPRVYRVDTEIAGDAVKSCAFARKPFVTVS